MPETLGALLALISAVGGLILSFLSHRRQTASSIIDDLDQVRKALTEENARLSQQIDKLKKELHQEKLKRVALEKRLSIERRLFSKRISETERQLKELAAMVNNAAQSKEERR